MAQPRFFNPTSAGAPVSALSLVYNPAQVSTDGLTTGMWQANTKGYGVASSPTVSGSMAAITTGIGLQSNPNRRTLYAQVIGSGGPLWLGYGVAPSSQAFHIALAAASADPGMNGGILTDIDYKGAVFVSGTIGCRYTLWEGV